MAKNSQLGIPEFSGERRFNETGDEFTGVYEFKDKNRQKHFRLHKTGIDRLDSKEIKTIWHSEMQARFIRLDPKFKLEVHYLGSEGNRRQADIVYDDRVCIELQHSSISKNELEERTKDALHRFGRVIWIFHHNSMIPKSSKWLKADSIIEIENRKYVKINYNQMTRLEQEVSDFEWRWRKYGVQVDLTKVKSYSPNNQPWEFSTCFGAEPGETVYFRNSTPPVYMYLNTLPRESLFVTNARDYNIKDYGTNVPDRRVSILFHYFEAPFDDEEESYEIFHKLEKGLTRQEAKNETGSEDFQKRLPYVSKHNTLCWDRLCFDEIRYNPHNHLTFEGYLHHKNNT